MLEDAVPTGTVRAWYGLSAQIVVGAEFWHYVKVGGVPLPHKALVNIVVRRGISEEDRSRLSYWHEAGHVQTLPLIVAYSLWLARRRLAVRGRYPPSFAGYLASILATLAAWEICAEAYTLAVAGDRYRRAHLKRPRLLFVAFWTAMSGLVLIGGRIGQ